MVAVLGPTASGKSEIAFALAQRHGAEIISVDSMQVYRGMDVGTAKPTAAVRAVVPHHMVDIVEPEVDYSVAEFQIAARAVLGDAIRRDVPVVIVGGSGLHFRALVDQLEFPPSDSAVRSQVDKMDAEEAVGELLKADPEAKDLIDLSNPRRVQRAVEIIRLGGLTPSRRAATPAARAVANYEATLSFTAIGLDPGESTAPRVEERMDAMLEAGLIEEVAALRDRLGRNASQAVGYKELARVVNGAISREEGRLDAINATVSLARRQRTFFRRDPRIRWIPWHEDAGATYDTARDVFGPESRWSE